nr:PREDICTED: endoplasmic reticulum aminopeptidase 2 isoform X1 [Bemisia tabaci]
MGRHGVLVLVLLSLGLASGTRLCQWERVADDVRLVPKGYALDVDPFPGDGVFKGRVRVLMVACTEAINAVKLDIDPAVNILKQNVKIRPRQFDGKVPDHKDLVEPDQWTDTGNLTVTSVEVKENEKQCVITLSGNLKKGEHYELFIQFEGVLGTDPSAGFYQTTYLDQNSGEKRWLVIMNLLDGKAPQVFPCFNRPEFKTYFLLSVAHKSEFHVLSSEPVSHSKLGSEGAWVRDYFMKIPSMSVGSLTIFESDFTQPNNYRQYSNPDGANDRARVGIWGRGDFVSALTQSQSLAPKVLSSLEAYLSYPYPLPELNLVALPGYISDKPIDGYGLQLFKESDLMNGDSFWLAYRLAKAMASQWLVHLSTPVNATSVGPALANFMALNVAMQLEQPVFNSYLSNLQSLLIEYSKPVPYSMVPLQKDNIVAFKTQLVFHMLEHCLGTETFKKSIHNFMKKREFKVYTDDDLWSAMTEQALADKRLLPGIQPKSVKQIVESWIVKDRLPLVTVTRHYNKSVTITQEPFLRSVDLLPPSNETDKPDLWWIPIVIVSEDKVKEYENISKIMSWLEPVPQQQISIKNKNFGMDHYLLFNPGSIGPFVVNYDNHNWFLLSQKVGTLPEKIRIQLLHDSMKLALSSKLSYITALNMTLFLRYEQAPAVWKTFYPLADQFRKLLDGTEAAKPFDLYLRGLITPVYDALGDEGSESSWKQEFRSQTKHLLWQAGFDPSIIEANDSYNLWMSAPDPDSGMLVSRSYLCSVFLWGSQKQWEFGLERVLNFPANRSQSERDFLFRTLAGCPQDPVRIRKILNITLLQNSSVFSESDKFKMINSIASSSIGYTTMFEFLKENWNALKESLSKNMWNLYVQLALGQFKSEAGLSKVTRLVEERKGQFGAAETDATASIEKIKKEIKWGAMNLNAIKLWLNTTLDEKWTARRFTFNDSQSDSVSHSGPTKTNETHFGADDCSAGN